MTHIEQAIRDAIDGGWKGSTAHSENFSHQDARIGHGLAALDAKFWQALKEAGYSDGEYIHGFPRSQVREKWHYLWVRFIDHLAGHSAGQFFEILK